MNMHSLSLRRGSVALTLVAMYGFGVAAGGCSLINSPDDVKHVAEPAIHPGDATVNPLALGSPVDASVKVDTGTPIKLSTGGAIVVGGLVADAAGHDTNVLTVIDPTTGAELAPNKRETFALAAVKYDGLRDLWYLFEASNQVFPDFVPGPAATVTLHVRSLDSSGTWTEHSKLTVPVPHYYENIVVLRDRISYVAYVGADTGSAVELVTFDTHDPAAIVKLDSLPLAKAPNVMLGTRSSTGPGGVLSIMQIDTDPTACNDAGTICDLRAQAVRVPNSGQPVLGLLSDPIAVAPKTAALTGASHAKRELELVIIPRAGNGQPTFAQLFQPVTQAAEGDLINFTVSDGTLRRGAIAECDDVFFTVGTNGDLNVHAVPLAGDAGTPFKTSTGHSGQAVYFEPFTKTVLATFAQGAGFDYSAFKLTGSSLKPVLARRDTDWTPPKDVRPVLLGIRAPVPFTCQ